MRDTLSPNQVDPKAMSTMNSFHNGTVGEVKKAISQHKVVVVGMAQNPVVKKARRILDNAGVKYHYMEYGSYMSLWKPRLAIKLWSGWPTFPQIFVDGKLIGGCADMVEWMKTNQMK